MSQILRLRAAVLCAASLSAAAAFAQAGDVVISVNGKPVTRAEYVSRMEVLPNMGRMSGGSFVPGAPGLLTLQQIINEMLMIDLAREQGVAVTEAEVDAELAHRIKRNPDFEKTYAALGMEIMRHDLRVQVAEFKLSTKNVTVTPFEIEAYYNGNKERYYTLPKRFSLSLIAVRTPEARTKVETELASGKSFAEVAREQSVDPSRFNDGRMGDLSEEDLSDRLKELTAVAKKGDVLPWLDQSGVQARIRIDDIKPSEVLPLDDTLREEIRRRLMLDRGQMQNNVPALMRAMRAKVKITYTGSPFDAQLKQLFGETAGPGIGL
jgi:parvulin-like peptidyl-prolyl isomerase